MRTPSLTRREFLQSTAVASSGAAVAHVASSLLLGQAAPRRPEVPAWATKPMRWTQLTLVEDDPAHFDPASGFDYFKRTRSDGGVPERWRVRGLLSDGDSFSSSQRVAGRSRCARRTDVGLPQDGHGGAGAHRSACDVRRYGAAHPDWIAAEAEGKPRRHWSSPEMWVTCAYGSVQFRVHDGGAQRDHVALSRRRDFPEPLGRNRRLLLPCTAGRTSRRRAGMELPRANRCAAIRRGGHFWSGGSSG